MGQRCVLVCVHSSEAVCVRQCGFGSPKAIIFG